MYRVQKFEVRDINTLVSVIDNYPFATVTSIHDGNPYVNHLPITAEIDSNGIKLLGHMSRSNPQWQHLRDGSRVTIAFQGPHAYINPSWYTANDVPTWNYVVVHANGRALIVDGYDGLIHILKKTAAHMNRIHEDKWDFYLPGDLTSERDLTSAIIGFEMRPDEIIGKFKLSQTRSRVDQLRVIDALGSRPDENSKQLKVWMSKIL
jgi:transcriptional regulator